MSVRSTTDVLVVGGGPAGCATAIELAAAGHHVTVLESSGAGVAGVPRGDMLVPAAVRELAELGVDVDALGGHAITGTRMWFGDRSVPVRWPDPDRTSNAAVIGHDAMNDALRDRAVAVGVDLRVGARATAPIAERGFVRGARVERSDGSTTDIGCRFLVVADGANSRFGRGIGTHRDRRWPYAISASTCVTSPRTSDTWIETHLGLLDDKGHPITGHGWVHPEGNGTLNIGLTVLSSYRDVLGVNVVKLLERFIDTIAGRWQFDPAERLVEPVRWRTPLGGSVHPKMGPTFLVTGDAAGMANPFNSHGVGAALATGRTAAVVLDEALTVGNSTTLQHYPAALREAMGQYHKVGRLSARFLGRPWLLRTALRSGIRSEAVMGAALRIATDELREGADRGGAERAYHLAAMVSRFAPSW